MIRPWTLLLTVLLSCSSKHEIDLNTIAWMHGSIDCSQNKDDAIQVVKYNSSTWLLRQNKCVNYEAPFMYLFFGQEKALLWDTGATEDSTKFPLRKTIDKLISN